MTTTAERVSRGAEYLDEHDPGWWRADVPNAIDLGVLDLGDGDACVLGQRCPLESSAESGYTLQVRRLTGGTAVHSDVLEVWAAEMGFTVSPYASAAHYYRLTVAWRTLIKARRAAS